MVDKARETMELNGWEVTTCRPNYPGKSTKPTLSASGNFQSAPHNSVVCSSLLPDWPVVVVGISSPGFRTSFLSFSVSLLHQCAHCACVVVFCVALCFSAHSRKFAFFCSVSGTILQCFFGSNGDFLGSFFQRFRCFFLWS